MAEHIELLAPAGDMERLRMSLAYGADAVYLAGTSFGMRAFAGNFSDEELPEAVKIELEENTQFWARYEGKTAEAAEAVNDAYLKVNGQAEGVKTYGRVVDLMLEDFVKNRRAQ